MQSNETMMRRLILMLQNPAGRRFTIACLLIALSRNAQAGTRTETSDALQIEYTWLRDAAFQERSQQRLLNIAQRKLDSGDYSDTFDVFHELLRQPTDSFLVPREGESVQGVRAAVTHLLESLPPAALAQWDSTCQGPARRELRQAIRDGNQNMLDDVIRRYPCSNVAADALLLRTTWLASRGELNATRTALLTLRRWHEMRILTQRQHATFQMLTTTFVEHWANHNSGDPPQHADTLSPAIRTLASNPAWVWQKSPWETAGGPNELPQFNERAVGNQFTHRPGSQSPILLKDAIIIRSPAGIARVNRDTGRQQWFLPFESVRRDSRGDETQLEQLFDFMPEEQNQLACDGETIAFLDGASEVSQRPQRPIQPHRTRQKAATRIVAIRNSEQPSLLWWSNGLSTFTSFLQSNQSEHTYTFDSSNSTAASAVGVPGSTGYQSRNTHFFQSAPVISRGRVFVTSRFDGLTYLNCLSATNGNRIWQQPLTWSGDVDGQDQPQKAVLGGIVDDVVVCLLSNGAIAGCRIADGTLVWMQSILVKSTDYEGAFALTAQAETGIVPKGSVGSKLGNHWVRAVDGNVICGRRGSSAVFCLNGQNGDLRWSTPGIIKDGIVSGQGDLGCVGIAGDNVILVGYSHCRALRLENGSQAWIRPTGDHSGRVAISGSRICVGLNADQLLVIDGVSGEQIHSQAYPTKQMGPRWAVDEKGLVDASAWQVTTRSWTLGNDVGSGQETAPPPSRLIGRPPNVAEAVLSPASLGDPEAQFDHAKQLLEQGERQQAELLLLNMGVITKAEPKLAEQRNDLLAVVRQPILMPGFEAVEPADLSDEVIFTETQGGIAGFRLREIKDLKRGSRRVQLRPSFPWWYRFPLAIDPTSRTDRISLVDVERGTEFAATDFDAVEFPGNCSRQDAWDNPGLIVIERDNFVGVASLFNTDPFGPLWLRQRPAARDGEVLALTSRRFVIADNAATTVVHPLTGELIWHRQWRASDRTRHLHGQYFKVYNTRQHVVLMSSMGTAYVVLDGNNGNIVRTANYSPGKLAKIIGEHLLIVGEDQDLTATNLITGETRRFSMTDVSDVHHARQFPEDIALVTSNSSSIILVDVASGETVSEITTESTRSNLRGPQMPLQVFRRAGLLYIAASVRDWRAQLSRPVFGEPQTGAGTLVCIDPQTGRHLWQRTAETIVIPPVYGDPCPFLVTWSTNRRPRRGLGRLNNYSAESASVTLTLLDAFTGAVVGQTSRRAIGIPLSVTHDATQRQLRISFADTAVLMNYAK